MSKNGFSLVELLIAMALSLITILMVMMLFKQVGRVAVSVAQDAEFDLQLETGMLVTQKLLQGAGYGTGNFDDVAIGSYSGRPAVFWRLRPDLEAEPIELICQGVAEGIEQDQNMFVHRLLLLASSSCSESAQLEDLSWDVASVLATMRSEHNEHVFDFKLEDECDPFGVKEIGGARKVIITGKKLNISEGLGQFVQRAVCLNNISSL